MKALQELDLPDDATEVDVKLKWKQLAREHHPDKGGDPGEFHKWKTIYQSALMYVTRPRKCQECLGTGNVISNQQGFYVLRVVCTKCKGVGRVKRS